ncbi:hypothetical protein H0E87_003318 [Populus deltoides]|uniref:Trafficking protein particle complex subunit 2 n=1 Tax=Populus deltoides TaxID=3696 RepID=A0A8T2ZZ83_POPDE|nr:hypothetical protein H0E87_003318 [Populus deltoides]
MATTACFIIVSRDDIPIYEAEVGSATKREDAAQMHQFILHAALDIVQDLAWTTSAMYLKAIDRFNDLVVSVYVTAGHILCVCDFNCYSDKKNAEKMENGIYVIFFAFSVGVYFP